MQEQSSNVAWMYQLAASQLITALREYDNSHDARYYAYYLNQDEEGEEVLASLMERLHIGILPAHEVARNVLIAEMAKGQNAHAQHPPDLDMHPDLHI